MTITISPEAERRLHERACDEGMSSKAYVEQLIRANEEWGEVPEAPIAHDDSGIWRSEGCPNERLATSKALRKQSRRRRVLRAPRKTWHIAFEFTPRAVWDLVTRDIEDVSKYPVLLRGLNEMGYCDIRKVLGEILLRLMRDKEAGAKNEAP